ncbi:MAG TPA: type IV toxin-antitoxin system AbiEi family antitoxin domain-containing protein [Solirubrobacteraceae bacterium]|nr:type IV toxin-antitoxin system AbiEi family antitoxin domain-containing protein [Solirubrobacteraceae bacterium]
MQSEPVYGAPDDTRLAKLAAEQHGVVSRAQLLRRGYSKRAIETRLATGRLHRIHRRVYAVGHTKLTLRGRWMAAVLACGEGAVVSHRDAAALHGLCRPGSGPIHVTAPGRCNVKGIRCHRARHPLDPRDVTVIDGIPVTTLERTLLDLAEAATRRQFAQAIEQAEREDKLDQHRIDALLARSPGRRGVKPLKEALAGLADEPAWMQSELERRFRSLTRAHRLPLPLTNQYVEGELVDAFWPQHELVVEVDSWQFHKTRRAFEDDRARDAKLVAAHYRVIRVTYERLRDDEKGVAGELRRALSDAPGRPPATSGP